MVSCRYSRPPVDTRGPWSMWRPRMDAASVESRLREVCQCPLRVGKLSPKLRFWTKFRNSGWHMPRPNSNTPDRLAALPRPGNAAKRPESTDEVDPVCPNSREKQGMTVDPRHRSVTESRSVGVWSNSTQPACVPPRKPPVDARAPGVVLFIENVSS